MTVKKLVLIITCIGALSLNSWANVNLSDSALSEINSFMNLRMELSVFEEKADALKKIDSYENEHKFFYSNFTEEENLIMENLYLLERYNYMVENKEKHDFLKKGLFALVEKNEAFLKSAKDINNWLYVISADCISCYMYFDPVKGAMKYGTKLKEYYEKCLELNPDNSYCLSHLAQWYYWAPGIAGGSKKKALSYFESALEKAVSNSDKYYAYIFLSQMQYDNGDKVSCEKNLSQAEKLMPASTFIKELKNLNAQGYSYFTGNKKKAEDEGLVSE